MCVRVNATGVAEVVQRRLYGSSCCATNMSSSAFVLRIWTAECASIARASTHLRSLNDWGLAGGSVLLAVGTVAMLRDGRCLATATASGALDLEFLLRGRHACGWMCVQRHRQRMVAGCRWWWMSTDDVGVSVEFRKVGQAKWSVHSGPSMAQAQPAADGFAGAGTSMNDLLTSMCDRFTPPFLLQQCRQHGAASARQGVHGQQTVNSCGTDQCSPSSGSAPNIGLCIRRYPEIRRQSRLPRRYRRHS